MPTIEKLIVAVTAETNGLTRGLTKGTRDLTEFADRTAKLGERLTSLGNRLSVGVTLPLTALASASIKLAADAGESASKLQAVFGSATAEMNAGIQQLRRTIPATTADLQEFTGSMGALLKPLGLAPAAAQQMSTDVVKLAGDLASFNNIPIGEALEKIRSGLVGQFEPLRTFGIVIDEARLKSEALALGLAKGKEPLNALVKAQTAWAIILKDSTAAQGDAARTADSASNQFKFLKANLQEAATIIGQKLLPVIVPVASRLADLAAVVGKIHPDVLTAGIAFTVLAAAIGPVITLAGALGPALLTAAKASGLLAGVSALGGLSALLIPGGAILVGIGLLVGGLYKLKKNADDARKSAEGFNDVIRGMSLSALEAESARLVRELERLNKVILPSEAKTGRTRFSVMSVEIARVEKQLANVNALLAQPLTLPGIAALPPSVAASPIATGPAIDGMKQLKDAIDAATTRLEFMQAAGLRLVEPLSAVRNLHRDIEARIAAQGGPLKANIELLRQQQVLAASIATTLERALDITPSVVPITGNALPLDTRVITLTTDELNKTAGAGAAATVQVQGLGDSLSALTIGARGLLQVADAIGGIGKQARQAIDGVLGLLDGISQISKVKQSGLTSGTGAKLSIEGIAGLASGISGLIGGVAQLASAFFGQSERMRQQTAVLEANNRKLEDVKLELSGFRINVASTAKAGDAAASIAGNRQLIKNLDFLSRLPGSAASDFGLQIRLLSPVLKNLGISFAELNAIAKANGIQLLDEKGRIVAGAFEQMATILKGTIKSLTEFNRALLDDLRTAAELRRDALDLPDTPVTRIQREYDFLFALAPNIAARFKDFDLTTSEEIAAFKAAYIKFIDDFTRNLIPAADFGGLTKDQLVGISRIILGAFDDMASAAKGTADAARELTAELRNVPLGVKRLNAIRFDATLPEISVPRLALQAPAIAAVTSAPYMPPTSTVTSGATSSFNFYGDINIDAGNRDGKQVYEEFMTEARRQARSRFGDTTRWADLP